MKIIDKIIITFEYLSIRSLIKSKLNPIGQIISCLDKTTLNINGMDTLNFCVHPSANKMMFAGPGEPTIAITKKIKPILSEINSDPNLFSCCDRLFYRNKLSLLKTLRKLYFTIF